MKTYTVYIEAKEYYTIEVQANDEDDAEDKAWRLFPHYTAHYGENNVTEIECKEDNTSC